VETLKWTDSDFANAPEGALPMGKVPDEWSYGDLDAGFKNAAVIVDETFVVQSTGHQPMETRSAMAYWQNGKLFLHGSTQSVIRTLDPLANWLGIDAANIVLISEYCGGGFGSKGGGAVSMAIPAMLSKKTGMPVMMRISREEELYIGRARTGMVGPRTCRLCQGRSHHRSRSLHRRGQRRLRADGRLPVGRQRRLVDLAAAGHALARRGGAHQHAAAVAAALARSDAGQRDHGTGGDEGGEEARPRSARHPPHQLTRGESALRRTAAERPAAAYHRGVRESGARSRRRVVQVGRAEGAVGQAAGIEGPRDWRRRRTALAPARSATTG
jgi:hypothetical protein